MAKRKSPKARLHALLVRDERSRPDRKQPSLPAEPWDHGADGPANRVRLVEEPATEIDPETGREVPNPNRVTRVRRILVLEEYAARGIITVRQFAIGLELHAASLGAPERDILAAIGDVAPQRSPGLSIARMIDARRKFRAMRSCLMRLSPETWPAVEAVCVDDIHLNARHAKRRDREAAMRALRAGLDLLANRAPWT